LGRQLEELGDASGVARHRCGTAIRASTPSKRLVAGSRFTRLRKYETANKFISKLELLHCLAARRRRG